MLRKTFSAFLLFCFLDLLLISCCTNTFNTSLIGVNFTIEDNIDLDISSIKSENLVLNLNLEYVNELANIHDFIKFSNYAYASSCDEEYIIINRVVALDISADSEINGIPQGNSLNSLFRLQINGVLDDVTNTLQYINNDTYFFGDFYKFIMVEPVMENTEMSFAIRIELEDGQIINRNTTTSLITIND